MNFDDFIKNRQVKKASSDKALIKSLIDTAKNDLLFLKGIQINKISARKVMSNYYDVLRSILEALASKHGYKIYSHEAFTYFLKKINEPIIADKFERFRKIRNSINYYGKDLSLEEVEEYVPEITRIIKNIKNKYFERH